MMQQLSGINVLVYYAPHTMTTDMGFDYYSALNMAAGIALTYWLFSFVQVFWLDQMGRRRPLIVGGILQAICFLCVRYPVVSCALFTQTDLGIFRPVCFRKELPQRGPRPRCSSSSPTKQSSPPVGSPSPGCTRPSSCRFGTARNRLASRRRPIGSSTT